MTKGEPMMPAPPRKRRLSAEQRRALAMLADAGRNGVTAAIMLANGLKTKMLAHLDREGLATAMIAERVKDGGKIIDLVRAGLATAERKTVRIHRRRPQGDRKPLSSPTPTRRLG